MVDPKSATTKRPRLSGQTTRKSKRETSQAYVIPADQYEALKILVNSTDEEQILAQTTVVCTILVR